jgi:hypothetical protein
MARSSGRRGRRDPRGGRLRSTTRSRVKQCPNPHRDITDKLYIVALSPKAANSAPDKIKSIMRAHIFGAMRCSYCGVVFLSHALRPDETIGYYDPPANVMGGYLEGRQPYPPHRAPPPD